MSEKRFSSNFYEEEWRTITDNGNELTQNEVVDLLNEQQATISQLEEENKKLIEDWEFSFRTELAHHRFAEKELQEKIREKQATIGKLQKENIELKKLRKYCAEWMGVKEENLYDVVR